MTMSIKITNFMANNNLYCPDLAKKKKELIKPQAAKRRKHGTMRLFRHTIPLIPFISRYPGWHRARMNFFRTARPRSHLLPGKCIYFSRRHLRAFLSPRCSGIYILVQRQVPDSGTSAVSGTQPSANAGAVCDIAGDFTLKLFLRHFPMQCMNWGSLCKRLRCIVWFSISLRVSVYFE